LLIQIFFLNLQRQTIKTGGNSNSAQDYEKASFKSVRELN
jgi:hypothetical protein